VTPDVRKVCRWCKLPKFSDGDESICICDSPDYERMEICDDCGEWTEMDKIRERHDAEYVCPGCDFEVVADGGQIKEKKPLKFAPGPSTNAVIAAKEGQKAATVRHNDEKEISEGDRLKLLKQHGERFGEADVTETVMVPAGKAYAAILDRDVLYSADGYDQMMGDLNDFYGGSILPGTEVKVIIFEPDYEAVQRSLQTDTDQ